MAGASLFKVSRIFIVFFACLTLIAFYYGRHDPTSAFYQPSQTPKWDYTNLRREQATTVIQDAITLNSINSTANITKVDPTQRPDLCVGIATIARPTNARYFASTVGSLLHNLAPAERARIHLLLFVAHIDQRKHPAWAEGWIPLLADSILTYDTLPRAQLDHVQEMENAAGIYKEKGIFDYTYLLEACAATGAAHTLMLEDDVLALDGWFHRSMAAIAEATRRGKDYLYIRLFYTDLLMGWNGETWPSYVFHSIRVFLITAVTLGILHYLTFRSRPGWRRHAHAYLSPRFMVLYLFVFLPACIALYFAAGRLTVHPPYSKTGIIEMHDYACCSQGMLFPAWRIPDVVGWLRERREGYVDVTLEEEANAKGGQVRYAMTPGVLQHTGTQSSKEGGGFDTMTDHIKSWTFETFDAEALRKEHEWTLKQQGIES